MLHTKKLYRLCLIVCAAWLASLAGCATPTPKIDVGAVVVAPRVRLPAPPVIVQTTLPKPMGYFQQSFLDYFGSGSKKPTTSMQPMPAAELTR